MQQGSEECLHHGATYAWVLSVCEALLLRFGFVFVGWLVCLFSVFPTRFWLQKLD